MATAQRAVVPLPNGRRGRRHYPARGAAAESLDRLPGASGRAGAGPAGGGNAVLALLSHRRPVRDAPAASRRRRTRGRAAGLPPAGKVEYFVEVGRVAEPVRIPPRAGETVILRYHGPVPLAVLIPHITVMFLAMLVGVRAGLAAVFDDPKHRTFALATLAGLTLGGLVLGPIAQKYAFGDFWTGVPFGWDLTDNKTLVMWIGWAAAGVALARRRRVSRWLVVVATVLMLTVYVVPHSVRGSALDCTRPPGTKEAHAYLGERTNFNTGNTFHKAPAPAALNATAPARGRALPTFAVRIAEATTCGLAPAWSTAPRARPRSRCRHSRPLGPGC